MQRLHLGLQVGQLTGRRHLPAVQPGSIPVDPLPDLFHVPLSPVLFPLQVAQLGVGHDDAVPKLTAAGVDLLQLSDFRQGPAAMVQPRQLGVQIGQFEQAQLRFGRCFHAPNVSRPQEYCRVVDMPAW